MDHRRLYKFTHTLSLSPHAESATVSMSFQHPAQTRTGHQVSTPYPFTALAPPSFLSHPDTSNSIQCRRQLITFDMLPDDVLLGLFDFYVDEDVDEDFEPPPEIKQKQRAKKQRIEAWITLAHVCRRWRSVVFQSPHRLNLRLVCKTRTPARDTLDIWPPLPLIIQLEEFVVLKDRNGTSGLGNIIAALEHNDRVCQIDFQYPSTLRLECLTAAMQRPFQELTDLRLNMGLYNLMGSRLPDSFLGGTAPRLRSLDLSNVPFPGLPNILLSATHLVYLSLHDVSWSGYIPPEVMATSLSALTSLEFLRLDFHFECSQPRPALESRRPPPPTRSILPSLTRIHFKGASEYLEEILARIDAPRLGGLHMAFFNQITFDTPQLFQFISRIPTLRAPQKGVIECDPTAITVGFPSQTSDYRIVHTVYVLCTESERQLSSLERVCTSSLPPVSTVEDLYLSGEYWPPHWQDDVENTLWLNILRSFVVVKNLYLSVEYVPRIAPALQELVGGRTTEVLPTLENIFLQYFQPSRSLQEGIEKFVAARRLTSHPVAVSRWDRWNHWELYIEDCDRY